MTREELDAYVRRIVASAPPLAAEDADRLRALLPLARRTVRPTRSTARAA